MGKVTLPPPPRVTAADLGYCSWRGFKRPLCGSGRLLHLGAIGGRTGSTVALGTVVEGLLARTHVAFLAGPGLESGLLEGAAVGEAELPGHGADGVHGVQVLGG